MGDQLVIAFVLAVLTAAVVIFISLWIREMYSKHFKGLWKSYFSKYTVEGTLKEQLYADMHKRQNVKNVTTTEFTDLYSADKLLQLLQEQYGTENVHPISATCRMDREGNPISCINTIEVKTEKDVNFYFGFFSNNWELEDYEGRQRFTGETFDPREMSFQDKISVIEGLEIMFDSKIEMDSDEYFDFISVLNQARLNEISYVESGMKKSNVRMLARGHGGLYLNNLNRPIEVQSDEYLDLAYSSIPMDIDGQTVQFKGSDAMKAMIKTVQHKKNIYLNGILGSGKSRWADSLQEKLSRLNNFNVIQLTASVVEALAEPVLQSEFRDILISEAQMGKINVLFIDEAADILCKDNKANDFVLQLLDGAIRRDMNITCVLSFDKTYRLASDYNPMVWRHGRADMVCTFTPLKREKANQLVQYLQKNKPDYHFDESRFDRFISKDNRLDESNVIYAFANEITLGDLYYCFIPKDERALWIKTIRRMAGQPDVPTRPKRDDTAAPSESTEKPTSKAASPPTPTGGPKPEEKSKPTISSHKKSNQKKRRRKKNKG